MDFKYVIIIIAIVFLLLVVLGLAIVNYSTEEMFEKFKDANIYSVGITPLEFAQLINGLHFENKIKIKFKYSYFADSFSSDGYLTISSKYANKNELAGLAICAHELGHAFQFKETPKKMKNHSKRLALSRAVSSLISPLIICGILFIIFYNIYIGLALLLLGLFVFFIAITTKLSTLKIEKEASIRAIKLLEMYCNLTEHQLVVAKKFLNSAKQTYLADVLKIMLKWTMLVRKDK